jgi:hypothetical protein
VSAATLSVPRLAWTARTRRGAFGLVLACLLAVVGVAVWRYGPWMPPAFEERPMLVSGDIPAALTIAADGAVWFTIENSNAIGVLRGGRLGRVVKTSDNLEPLGLAVSPTGDVWFTDAVADSIGHLAAQGWPVHSLRGERGERESLRRGCRPWRHRLGDAAVGAPAGPHLA